MGIASRELQHCNTASTASTYFRTEKHNNFWETFVNRNGLIVPSHCQPTDTPPAVRNEGDTTLLPSTLDLLSLYIGLVKLLHWTC